MKRAAAEETLRTEAREAEEEVREEAERKRARARRN